VDPVLSKRPFERSNPLMSDHGNQVHTNGLQMSHDAWSPDEARQTNTELPIPFGATRTE